MNAEDFIVDDSSETEVVENFGTISPDVERSILSEAFVIESIDLCNLSGLVITSDKSDSVRVSHLEM